VTDINKILTDERYRKIAEVGKSNAPYYPFTMEIVQEHSKEHSNRGQKIWLMHHGLIETWDMVEYD